MLHRNNILALRRGLGMSQHEFATFLQVSPGSIYNWEAAKYRGPGRFLVRRRLYALLREHGLPTLKGEVGVLDPLSVGWGAFRELGEDQ